MRTALLPDEVWIGLDPRSGRLTRRGRLGVLCAVVASVVVLGLAVLAGVTGAIEPRVTAQIDEADLDHAHHAVVLRVDVGNEGTTDLHVDALTTDDARYDITAAPTGFVVAAHTSRVVRIDVAIRSCAAVSPTDTIPLTIVVAHWWGDRDRALFSTDDPPILSLPAEVCRAGRH